MCDGAHDCTDGEDEDNCDTRGNCGHGTFMCHVDGSCVPINQMCDGLPQCPDGSDELVCHPLSSKYDYNVISRGMKIKIRFDRVSR